MTNALADDVLTSVDTDAALIAGRHIETGKVVFPWPTGVERRHFERIELTRTGTLWSWSVQRFLPKSPPYMGTETIETFKPYIFGYVELPGQVIVETRIVNAAEADLKIGMDMTLAIIDFDHKERGVVKTYAFEPA
ncbi:MAG: OB-fold domain-containing protein [Pseudomonadota bacterium]